jgi:hypothetical protein
MVDMANAMGIQPVITTYAVGDVEADPMIDTPGGISERSGGGSSVGSSGRSSGGRNAFSPPKPTRPLTPEDMGDLVEVSEAMTS